MGKSFNVIFSNHVIPATQVSSATGISASIPSLGLSGSSHRVLVVIGGASKLSEADYQKLQRLFTEVLAPLAEKWQACVVDGGTDAGVMKLMGEARTAIAGSFPLIGVTPVGLAMLPGEPAPSEEAASLEPSHTHFLLVPGSSWGDESGWIANVASELADDAPSVAVLINGGEVTWHDALCNVQAGRLVVVVDGSGRTADKIAAGLRGEPTDVRASALIDSKLVRSVHLNDEINTLSDLLENIFNGEEA